MEEQEKVDIPVVDVYSSPEYLAYQEVLKIEREDKKLQNKIKNDSKKEYFRIYRANNRDKMREYARVYRIKYPDRKYFKTKEEQRAYYAKNKDRHKIYRERAKPRMAKWYANNKERTRLYARKWRKEHPEDVKKAVRRKELKSKYGMTTKDWDRMLIEQSGCCCICDLPFGNSKKFSPAVEHNHYTNEVYGLAHMVCNVGIGLFNENPILLRKLVNYCERTRGVKNEETQKEEIRDKPVGEDTQIL